MRNGITIRKRGYLNKRDYANFEFSDNKGRGCIIMVWEQERRTILRIVNKDKEIRIVEEKNDRNNTLK